MYLLSIDTQLSHNIVNIRAFPKKDSCFYFPSVYCN